MLWFNVLLFFGTGISACVSYKILSLTHIPTRSHHILASRLVEELSKKGHEVTFVTIYPSETPLQNVTEISLEGLQDFLPGK